MALRNMHHHNWEAIKSDPTRLAYYENWANDKKALLEGKKRDATADELKWMVMKLDQMVDQIRKACGACIIYTEFKIDLDLTRHLWFHLGFGFDARKDRRS